MCCVIQGDLAKCVCIVSVNSVLRSISKKGLCPVGGESRAMARDSHCILNICTHEELTRENSSRIVILKSYHWESNVRLCGVRPRATYACKHNCLQIKTLRSMSKLVPLNQLKLVLHTTG